MKQSVEFVLMSGVRHIDVDNFSAIDIICGSPSGSAGAVSTPRTRDNYYPNFESTETDTDTTVEIAKVERRRRIFFFLQQAGETVFIPRGWYHAILNIADNSNSKDNGGITVAITHNFVPIQDAADFLQAMELESGYDGMGLSIEEREKFVQSVNSFIDSKVKG
jgi:hypothetical protein